MRNEGDPLAAIAIPGWGMAIILVLIIAVMVLICRAMFRRLGNDAQTVQPVADERDGDAAENSVEPARTDTEKTEQGETEQHAVERHADDSTM